ncbi:TBC1 domain family member 25-like [Lytechinus variegatus]|uniref:TBC1 domain family member 25-like n=1 Tax=Lytechinus variegatus TaxID=7654 RepID=UPI001BB10EC9|nr:TBC1 domain family member 25-like [Lytechinus variegatus]
MNVVAKMAGISGKTGTRRRDAIRVQVMKCSGLLQPEYKSFSIDPEITSFDMLQLLLVQAFQLKIGFTISYLSHDDRGQEVYLSMLSDWDLDAAICGASDPCLRLKVDAKPFDGPGLLEDWDVITGMEAPLHNSHDRSHSVPLVGAFMDQVGKTFNRFQKIFTTNDDSMEGEKYEMPMRPLDDQEFWSFLDPLGRLERPQELRIRVYQGGVESSLRKVVWRHLLNIYPEGMTGNERLDYIRTKSREYERLRDRLQNDPREDFKNIKNMVRKDVLRTDRLEKFYSGGDENPNGIKLFNVLTTYSLAHPDVSYCQGMSDLASPILYVMNDEAQAYICFCSLMKRLKGNFMPDGHAMSIKFLHLTELIRCLAPDFYDYLKEQNADDLYFCYRWLLLELKREFAFQDALRMLEIMWSSLPPDPPTDGVTLNGPITGNSPSAYAIDRVRFRFSRLRSSSRDSLGSQSSLNKTPQSVSHADSNSKEQLKEEDPSRVSETLREVDDEEADSNKNEEQCEEKESCATKLEPAEKKSKSSKVKKYRTELHISIEKEDLSGRNTNEGISNHRGQGEESKPNNNAKSHPTSLAFYQKSSDDMTSPGSETSPLLNSLPKSPPKSPQRPHPMSPLKFPRQSPSSPSRSLYRGLPPPQDFGGGNPFMMFVCAALLLGHSRRIMANKMDYNEMAMLFDRMVRKHHLSKVLHHARALYLEYLQSEAARPQVQVVGTKAAGKDGPSGMSGLNGSAAATIQGSC